MDDFNPLNNPFIPFPGKGADDDDEFTVHRQGKPGPGDFRMGKVEGTQDYGQIYARMMAASQPSEPTPQRIKIHIMKEGDQQGTKCTVGGPGIPAVGDQIRINSEDGASSLMSGTVTKVEWIYTIGSANIEILILIK